MLANIAFLLSSFLEGLTQFLRFLPAKEVSFTFNSLPYLEQTDSEGLPERAFDFANGAAFALLYAASEVLLPVEVLKK